MFISHGSLKAILDKYEHDPESLRAAGLAYAVDQIVDLVTQDVAGVHLYTMNNEDVAYPRLPSNKGFICSSTEF